MAEAEVVIPEDGAGDEDMEVEGLEGTAAENEPTGLEDIEPTMAERTTFLEYEYRCTPERQLAATDRATATCGLPLSS